MTSFNKNRRIFKPYINCSGDGPALEEFGRYKKLIEELHGAKVKLVKIVHGLGFVWCIIYEIGNHLYWSNKTMLTAKIDTYRAHNANIKDLERFKQIDLSKYKFEGIDKRQVLRNMVEPEDGKYIFEQITGEKL
jgi:hypothetical protein